MKVDILLQQISVQENGTSFKSCPGLMVINVLPPCDIQAVNPGGRKLVLKDNQTILFSEDYREQLEMRAVLTGKSWVEVQIISMHDFGLIGVLIQELTELAKKSWPLPIGSSLLDRVSADVKKGAPQVIAFGKSDVFPIDSFPKVLAIAMAAPADVLGDMSNLDPVTNLPSDQPMERQLIMPKGTSNGSVTLKLYEA